MSRGILRDVTEADMDLLYNWVNDPISRASAFDNHMILYEDHCNWFRKMMCDQSVLQYIYEMEQQPIGQVRVEIKDEIGVIDYSIAPEYRLHGYGNDIINLLIKKMKTNYPELEILKAKVKPENIASQKVFRNNNFMTKYYEFEYDLNNECQEKCQEKIGGVLILTNNNNTILLYDWVAKRVDATLYSDRVYIAQVKRLRPKLIISYNYNYIISQDIIDYMHGNIINMHISLLPWNRGFSPNLWSFLDDTPKGVTIHKISAGLDKGELIWQREMYFDAQKETLESTYNKLNEEIVKLFQEHWEEIINESYKVKEQIGKGSYHSKKQLEQLQERIPFEWSDCVADVVQRYKKMVKINESNNCNN